MPTEDIKEGKIYCIRDTSSTAQDNNYIEYAYINNKWEKVGEFQAKPDLSGYAKLSGAIFTGNVSTNVFRARTIWSNSGIFLRAGEGQIGKAYTFLTDGTIGKIGTPEDLIFTLEDGSTVTKSIRVISTTTSKAEA